MHGSHASQCLDGCIDSLAIAAGAILRFTSDNPKDAAEQHGIGEQLVVLLKKPNAPFSMPDIHNLYYCAVITRKPLPSLGKALRIHHVQDHNLEYFQAFHPSDLFMTENPSIERLIANMQFTWDARECVQPANVRRIPQRCLHQLLGGVDLRLTDPSLENLLKKVDSIASALGDPVKLSLLPMDVHSPRRKEDIMTLNLWRIMDHLASFPVVVEPAATGQRRRSRVPSVWDQASVPRKGRP